MSAVKLSMLQVDHAYDDNGRVSVLCMTGASHTVAHGSIGVTGLVPVMSPTSFINVLSIEV
ncbi:MAG: hypothetical protein NVSMB54_33920 [Ktedonobacteraceae bacterium]